MTRTIDAAELAFRNSCGCAACKRSPRHGVSRRRLLTGSIACAIAGGACIIGPASAQTTLSPDAAVQRLMEGNARFVSRRLDSFAEDLDVLKQGTVQKQEPFAGILSCADSRVPVELVFDQSIGHVFAARVAGNICTPEIIASLEYGAAVLGTAAIVVLAHSGCGAVKATIGGKPAPGQISALYAPIRQAVERAGSDVDSAAKANAQIQAELLRTASPVIADLAAAGKLKVVAAFYELASGKVSLLG